MSGPRLRVVDRPQTANPLGQLGEALSRLLSPQAGVHGDRIDVKLRTDDGSDLRVEWHDGSVTIRGAVLTLRPQCEPDALAGSRKRYF